MCPRCNSVFCYRVCGGSQGKQSTYWECDDCGWTNIPPIPLKAETFLSITAQPWERRMLAAIMQGKTLTLPDRRK